MWIADESILDQSLDVAEYVPPTFDVEVPYADDYQGHCGFRVDCSCR